MEQPERLGRYEIERILGHGATGIVYLARDPLIDRAVAIKTLRRDLNQKCMEGNRKRFVHEARAAGRLSHPNIVTIYDVVGDKEHEDAFIVMEYVEGTTLKDVMATGTQYDAHRAALLTSTLAGALSYAHSQGVIHRDVKPANIILTAEGSVKIADFGIARLDTSDLTAEGAFIGTPNYMSPEQIKGLSADGRSDLYSLGVILFELITGQRPFSGKSLPELSVNIANRPVPNPSSLCPGLPESLSTVIQRCLAKEPADRYQTGNELKHSLDIIDLTSSRFQSAQSDQPEQPGFWAPTQVSPSSPLSPPDHHATRPRETAQITGEEAAGLLLHPWQRAARRIIATRWFPSVAVLVALLLTIGIGSLLISDDRGPFEDARVPENVQPQPDSGVYGRLNSTLVVVHKNRLSLGFITLSIDGSKVWSKGLTAKQGVLNTFSRISGTAIEQSISIPEGPHTIEVNISGESMKVEAKASIEGEFRAGETRRLKVSLNPYTDTLKLAWDD